MHVRGARGDRRASPRFRPDGPLLFRAVRACAGVRLRRNHAHIPGSQPDARPRCGAGVLVGVEARRGLAGAVPVGWAEPVLAVTASFWVCRWEETCGARGTVPFKVGAGGEGLLLPLGFSSFKFLDPPHLFARCMVTDVVIAMG